MTRRIRWSGPLPLLAVIVAGSALRVRALTAGFILDDYHQIAALEHATPVQLPFWNLYSFFRSSAEVSKLMDVGRLPWWTDTAMRLSFFRPLTSATFALDLALFGHRPVLWHMDSLLWWTAMVLAAAWLLRHVLTARGAVLAVLTFALDEAHTVPVTWIANRHSLIAATFVLLSLGALVRNRVRLSCAFFGIALASGEYATSGLAFLFAWLLLDRTGPFRHRLTAIAPHLALTAIYLGIRQWMHYGVRLFPVYVDPVREARAVPAWVFHQVGRLLGDLALGVPEEAPRPPWLIGVTVVVLIVLWRLAPRARTWLFGAIVALLPLSLALASARQLVLPCFGVAAAVGMALDGALSHAAEVGSWNRTRAFALLVPLVAVHWLWAPSVAWAGVDLFSRVHSATRHAILSAQAPGYDSSVDVVLLGVGDPTTLLYFPEIRHIDGGHPLPHACWTLTADNQRVLLRRVAANALEVRVPVDAPFLTSETARLFRRRDRPLAVGETVHTGAMEVTTVVAGRLGPTLLRVQFDRSLDDPSLRFLIVTPHGIRPFEIPPVSYADWLPPAVDASTIP